MVSHEAELAKYADPYPVGADLAGGPSAVVSPGCVEEVQAVVRAANKYGVPLSAVATGKNNGYGGAAPRLAGAVVVNTGADEQDPRGQREVWVRPPGAGRLTFRPG